MWDPTFRMRITGVRRSIRYDRPEITGEVLVGELAEWQATELHDGTRIVPVPGTLPERDSLTGELRVVLFGLDMSDAHPGQELWAAMRWPQFSTVRFVNDDHREDGAPRGTEGTILDVGGTAYNIEVTDLDGTSPFVDWVRDGDLELVRPIERPD